jgi:hypothetical protein
MQAVSRPTLAVITFNDIPAINHTFKYEVLGRMAIDNRRRYCDRHGYDFISNVPIARDRPACWAKIPAILDAFRTHDWVLWADSDTLVLEEPVEIDALCDPAYDLIVQTHDRYYRMLGIPESEGLRRMPINTGVFLIRSSSWSVDFLQRAYARTEFVSHGAVWNGIGEQEAMIALLQERPQDLRRIKHVDLLQSPPKFYRPGTLFLHFYGNHARHRIRLPEAEAVLAAWHHAIRQGQPLPGDFARFHWCCIQNKRADSPVSGGDLPRYLYSAADIAEHRP